MVYNLNLKLFDYKISFVKLINNNEFRYLKKDRLYPNIYIFISQSLITLTKQVYIVAYFTLFIMSKISSSVRH